MSSRTLPDNIIFQLKASQEFFNRSTNVLEESDSSFRPTPDMMTAAQQIAHAALTIGWFIQGTTSPDGFDLDFEKAAREIEAVTSITAARQLLDAAYAKAIAHVETLTPEDLAKPLPPNPIMDGQPAVDVYWGLIEHTAHHRGALSVYTRLSGKVPAMPYA